MAGVGGGAGARAGAGAGGEWMERFFFQQRHGKLNVRRLERLDLCAVVDKVDVGALHDVLENVAFCNLKKADLQHLADDTVVKAFRVAQLIIEYLINVQNSLFGETERLGALVEELETDAQQLQEDNRVLADDNDALAKDLRQKRKALATFEYVLTVHGPKGAGMDSLAKLTGAKGGSEAAGGVVQASVCGTCGKTFSTREFLRRHCVRRSHRLPSTVDSVLDGKENAPQDGNASNAADLVAQMQETLAETLKSRETQVQDAVERTRESERRLYEEQLNTMRQDRRLHEERLEAHFKTQLMEQQMGYEQRIASLEAKLDMARSWQLPQSSSASEDKESHQRIQRLETQLREYQSSTSSTVVQEHKKQREAATKSELSLRRNLEVALRETHLQNFVRSVRNVFVSKAKVKLSSSFAKWKVVNMGFALQATKARIEQDIAAEDAAFPSPKRAVAKHVAKFAEASEEHRPIGDDAVRRLTMQFLHAQKEDAITDEERQAMQDVDALMDARASVVQAKFSVERQPMDFIPIQSKPYLRARWDHRADEVRAQLQEVNRQLLQTMSRYDPALPAMTGLSDQQFIHLKRQIDLNRKSKPEEQFHKALNAVQHLANELTEAFYRPVDTADQEDLGADVPLTRPDDALLVEAMIPISERHKNKHPGDAILRDSISEYSGARGSDVDSDDDSVGSDSELHEIGSDAGSSLLGGGPGQKRIGSDAAHAKAGHQETSRVWAGNEGDVEERSRKRVDSDAGSSYPGRRVDPLSDSEAEDDEEDMTPMEGGGIHEAKATERFESDHGQVNEQDEDVEAEPATASSPLPAPPTIDVGLIDSEFAEAEAARDREQEAQLKRRDDDSVQAGRGEEAKGDGSDCDGGQDHHEERKITLSPEGVRSAESSVEGSSPPRLPARQSVADEDQVSTVAEFPAPHPRPAFQKVSSALVSDMKEMDAGDLDPSTWEAEFDLS